MQSRPQQTSATTADAAGQRPATVLGDLLQISDASLAYLSLEDLLAALLERIREALGADTAAILMVDEERGVLLARAAKGIEEEVRAGVTIPLGRGFAGRVAHERRPIAIEDVDHSYVLNPLLRQKGIKSLLGVPLLIEGRAIGVLHVGTLVPRTFDEDAVRLLQLVADRAALAIDNARLSEQRNLTEVMQRTLLPEQLPRIPGLRLSAKYLPAAAGLKVGGDWYDVFPLPDGRIALVIGDAVGHGVAAAAVMAEVRTALRSYAVERHPPLRIIALLNDLLHSMGRSRVCTLALMALDFERAELELISAGHLPAILLHPDRRHELIGAASGPPLGALPAATYKSELVPFPTGSSLLAYTDGLVERRGRDIDAGIERLITLVIASAGREIGLADAVFEDYLAEAFEDDVALLGVEAIGFGDRFALELDAAPAVLSPLRRSVSRWLEDKGASEPERFDLALACSEAVANAIEHAYGPLHATLDIAFAHDDGRITITVSDHGSWRPRTGEHGGRGLALMEELVDSVSIEATDTGTTVRLERTLGRQ